MGKVSDIYKLYLKPHHLRGQSREATIAGATVETLHPQPGIEEQAIVICFEGKPHRLILNQTNAMRMYDLAGDVIEKWAGLRLVLRPAKWGKKDTIVIEPGNQATV